MNLLDPQRAMAALEDGTVEAIKTYFPLEGREHVLTATNVRAGTDVELDDVQSQKKAKIRGRTWAVGIYGDFTLTDKKTGKVIDQAAGVKIAALPKLTRRLSFIVEGGEYQVDNQWRLKSGVYTRQRQNGELEAQFNLARGRGFRMDFSPEKRQFLLRYGTTNVQLLPTLRALGVPDADIRQAWGAQVFDSIAAKRGRDDVVKLAKALDPRFVGKSEAEAAVAVRAQLDKTELLPETTRITLGEPFTKVDGSALLRTSAKLLGVSRGTDEVDNRDSLRFKELWTVQDLVPERIRNSQRRVTAKLKNNLDRKDAISDIVTTDVFNVPVKSFFTVNTLSQQTNQVNPVDMMGGHLRTTLLGRGGIGTERAITLDAKLIDPSSLGVVDLVHSPEGSRAGIAMHLTLGVNKRGREPTIAVFDLKQRKKVERTPAELAGHSVAFPDQYVQEDGKFTPVSKTVVAIPRSGGEPRELLPGDVDFALLSPKQMFSVAANLIPFLPSDQGNRAGMATRHLDQSISLKHREAPLVQVVSGHQDPKLDTWEKIYGRAFSHVAPADGTVTEVASTHITLRGEDRKTHQVSLYDNYPLNEKKAGVNSFPLVKVGDTVKTGDVVADTSWTKNGVLAAGVNMRVGFMSWRGLNFEDGIVVSESAAERMSSEHLYKPRVYLDKGMGVGLQKFRANYPGVVSDQNAKKLDQDGVIKKGQKVQPGDVIMTVLRKTEPSPEQVMLKGIHKALARPYRDASVVWDHDYAGTVTDVVRNGNEITAYVATEEPIQQGDKISFRHGNKGVIAEVVPDEEMPRNAQGEPLEIILNTTGVPGRCYDDQTEFMTETGWKLGKDVLGTDVLGCFDPEQHAIQMHAQTAPFYSAPYVGPLLECRTEALDFSVTPAHKMWCQPEGCGWRESTAESMYGKRYFVPTAAKALELPGDAQFTLPAIARNGPKDTAWTGETATIDAGDWAEFLGWYLAEGSFTWDTTTYEYRTHIAQRDVANPGKQRAIAELLGRLPFAWYYSAKNTQFHLSSKPLVSYVRQFGKSADKFVPDWLFRQSIAVRDRFLAAYWAGDGSVGVDPRDGSLTSRAASVSRRLADDLQRLLVLQGVSSSVCAKKERPECQPGWRLTRHVRVRRSTRGAWRTRAYDGVVYCPSVPTGYVVTRRNGKLLLAGNTNPGQVLETMLGKVANQTGTSFAVDNFQQDPRHKIVEVRGHFRTVKTDDGPKKVWVAPHTRDLGYQELVQAALDKHKVSDTEELFDPATGRSFGPVMTGYQYAVKETHQADKKLTYRSYGAGNPYNQDMAPKGGGESGAQRFSELGLYALLAHGALANVRESLTLKSDRTQSDVWLALQTGEPIPAPKTSFAYDKFLAYLRGVGLDVEKNGNELRLLPFTDAQVREVSRGELKDPAKVFRGKDLKPEPGGLFDERITGGPGGKGWGHIELTEAVPNPVFERAILSLLGLTGAQYDAVIAGQSQLDGKSGPSAVVAALSKLDIEKELASATEKLKTARRAELDRANKKVKYLRALKEADLSAADAYGMKALPVIPPIYRPITAMEAGDLSVDGVNLLYREVALLNQKVREGTGVLPDEAMASLRKELFGAVEALTGVDARQAGMTSAGEEKPSGILTVLSGRTSPKESFVHTRLLDRGQDLTARAVITPEPSLSIDEISLPREAAREIFRPFTVRELVAMGQTPLGARDEIEKDTPVARRALEVAMSKRPVLFKRDPMLHKYSIMAFQAKTHEGKTIKINPLVTGPFGADFDGDAMSVFVPLTSEAVAEAQRMRPSQIALNPASGTAMFQPSLEGQLGLYLISQFGAETDKRFSSHEELLAAAKKGDVKQTDVVTVDGKRTTAGRVAVWSALPVPLRADELLTDPAQALGKNSIQKLMQRVAREHPKDFGPFMDKLKNIGWNHAHESGFSFSMSDFAAQKEIRDRAVARARVKVHAIQRSQASDAEKDKRSLAAYFEATDEMSREAKAALDKNGNKLRIMNNAGIKPGWNQVQQILLAPMLLEDARGRVQNVPVTRSYAEGLDTAGYWTASHGVRKGLVDKVLSVQKPGVFSKQLANTAVSYTITADDCGTDKGIALPITDNDVVDRYLVKETSAGGATYAAGTLVTPGVLDKLRQAKADRVLVRSPLKCQAKKGLCSKCYGAGPDGNPMPLGTNIGLIAGQAIGERGTQLSMKVFHTGGVASGPKASSGSGLDRVNEMLKLPEVLPNKATLSEVTGKVRKVAKSPVGGWDIEVGDETHYVPNDRDVAVKTGDAVERGDRLSSGAVDPRELLDLTSIDNVQRYMADELHNLYAAEGIKRRNAEVVVKTMTNLGRVVDPGGSDEFIRGDYVPLAYAQALNREGKLQEPVVVEPVLRGLETLPLDQSRDWMGRLQYRKLKETMVRGAAEGWKSNLHAGSPVPGVLYAAEFGKPKPGDQGPY